MSEILKRVLGPKAFDESAKAGFAARLERVNAWLVHTDPSTISTTPEIRARAANLAHSVNVFSELKAQDDASLHKLQCELGFVERKGGNVLTMPLNSNESALNSFLVDWHTRTLNANGRSCFDSLKNFEKVSEMFKGLLEEVSDLTLEDVNHIIAEKKAQIYPVFFPEAFHTVPVPPT